MITKEKYILHEKMDSTAANTLWNEKISPQQYEFAVVLPFYILKQIVKNISNLSARPPAGGFEWGSVTGTPQYEMLWGGEWPLIPGVWEVRGPLEVLAKDKEKLEQFKQALNAQEPNITKKGKASVQNGRAALEALLEPFELDMFATFLDVHIVEGLIKGKITITSLADLDVEKPEEEPEEKKKEKKKADKKTVSGKDIFITTPQHASVRINEAADTLTYGEYDPLGLYKSPIKMPLNKTIKDIFGYEGGWKEYKRENLEDITKKTIVIRKDGTRVEADKPQNLKREEGDRLVQSATLWPFHVYFAFKEYAESPAEKNSYKHVYYQDNVEAREFLKTFADRFRAAVVTYFKKNNKHLTTNQVIEEMRKKGITEKVEFSLSGLSSFLKHQEVLTRESKYYKILSKRIGVFGVQKNWFDDKKEGARGGSPFMTVIENPPEKISNADIINVLMTQGLRTITSISSLRQNTIVFSPDGKSKLYHDSRKTYSEIKSSGEEMFPRVATFSASESEPYTLYDPYEGRNISTPVLGLSFALRDFAPHWDFLQQNGLKVPKINMGTVLLLPENDEAFTEAEKVLFTRLGVNKNTSLEFDVIDNKYNTPSGAFESPFATNAKIVDQFLGDEDDTEEDDATDLGGMTISSTQVSMKDLPEEIKKAMKDPNVKAEELIQRRLDFCKRPERKENPTFLCTMGEEGDKMWREIAYVTKDAQKNPSKEKLEIIKNKQKEFLDAVNKEALGTPEGESADDYGSAKEYENPNESDEKRQERYRRLRDLEDKISGRDTEGRRAPEPSDREKEIYGNLREKIKDERETRERINEHILVLLNRFGGGIIKEQNPKSWKTLGVFWEWTGVGVNQSVSSAQAKAAKFASAGLVDNLFRGWNQKKHKDLEKGGQTYYNKKITESDLTNFYRYNTKKWKLKELPYGPLEKYIEDFKNKVIPVPYGSHWSAITIQYMMRADPDFAEHSRKGGKKGQYKNAKWGRRGNVMGHASYIGWGKREALLLRRSKRKILKGEATLDPRTYITLSIEKIKEIGYEPQVGDIIVDTGGHGDVVTTRGRVGGNLSRSIRSRSKGRTTGPIRGMFQKSRYIVTKSMIAKRLYLGLPAEEQTDVASTMQETKSSSAEFLNESLNILIQEIKEGKINELVG